MLRRCRYWKWEEGRNEYSLKYNYEDWKVRVLFTVSANVTCVVQAILPNDEVAGTFAVPFRPHVFSKPTPTTLQLAKEGLAKDEVLLILIFVYSEAKRQDQTVCSSSFLPTQSDRAHVEQLCGRRLRRLVMKIMTDTRSHTYVDFLCCMDMRTFITERCICSILVSQQTLYSTAIPSLSRMLIFFTGSELKEPQ